MLRTAISRGKAISVNQSQAQYTILKKIKTDIDGLTGIWAIRQGTISLQKFGYVILVKPAIASSPYPVSRQHAAVAPSSYCINVDMKKAGYVCSREHFVSPIYHYHVTSPQLNYFQISYLHFNLLNLPKHPPKVMICSGKLVL